jgi:hypothetical protein
MTRELDDDEGEALPMRWRCVNGCSIDYDGWQGDCLVCGGRVVQLEDSDDLRDDSRAKGQNLTLRGATSRPGGRRRRQ